MTCASSFFLGACTLLLAILSFCSRRRKLQATVAALAAVSVALALGSHNPLYRWLFDHVAVFRLGRYPSKYFLLSSLAAAILASLGVEAVLNAGKLGKRSRRWLMAVGGCCLIAGIAALAYCLTWPSHVGGWERWIRAVDGSVAGAAPKNMPAILALLQRSLLASGAFLSLGSALVLGASLWRRATLAGGVLVLLLSAELLPANLRLTPLISDADVSYVPEINRYLARDGPREPYRVVPPTLLRRISDIELRVPNLSSAWLTLFYKMSGQPFYGIMNGIQYSLDRPVDFLGTAEADTLWRICVAIPESAGMTMLTKLNSPVLLFVGELHDPRIRPIAAFGLRSNFKLNVYWLENTISRAFFVSNVEKASSHSDALQRFLRPDFPFGNTVVLEDRDIEARGGQTATGTARIEHYGNRRVACRVEARGAGYLVLLDSFYPGWSARLDGKEVQVLRADYAFRAVAVPAGSHLVEFRYRPRSFDYGLALTLISLSAGIVVAVVRRTARRAQGEAQP